MLCVLVEGERNVSLHMKMAHPEWSGCSQTPYCQERGTDLSTGTSDEARDVRILSVSHVPKKEFKMTPTYIGNWVLEKSLCHLTTFLFSYSIDKFSTPELHHSPSILLDQLCVYLGTFFKCHSYNFATPLHVSQIVPTPLVPDICRLCLCRETLTENQH